MHRGPRAAGREPAQGGRARARSQRVARTSLVPAGILSMYAILMFSESSIMASWLAS